MKKIISFLIVSICLILVTLYSMATGSIKVGFTELIQGLALGGNDQVDVIRDMRLPRIFVAMLSGASLAVSGVLLQAVMRNPLADAGIIGISAGAGFVSVFVAGLFPMLILWMPLFSVLGGLFACFLVYAFTWRSGMRPLHLILVGVAINAMFSGLNQVYNYAGSMSGVQMSQAVTSIFNMKVWNDVDIMVTYGGIGLVIALCLGTWCNLLALQDRTASNLGLNVMRARIIVSFVAVLLASIATAIGGLIAFVGLLVPHISRYMVGTNHKLLIPFSALLGGLLILLADTVGRVVIAPLEIPASVIMMIVGGPFLIFMLIRGERLYGN